MLAGMYKITTVQGAIKIQRSTESEDRVIVGSILMVPDASLSTIQRAVILAPDENGVETSWKSASGTDAGMSIGNAGAQMLVKLLELERLLELDHVSALVSLSGFFPFQSLFLG
ncbi:hypothetical protein TNCV_4620411 [Trichonephila clavipes]|nr:hypothetical protein TNCV_4620411 [Trichonephila clavipes]